MINIPALFILMLALISVGFAFLYMRLKMARDESLCRQLSSACSILGSLDDNTNISEALDRLCRISTQETAFEYALICLQDQKTGKLYIQATGGTAASILSIGYVLDQTDNQALYDSYNSGTTVTCMPNTLGEAVRSLLADDDKQLYIIPFGHSNTRYGVMIVGPFIQEAPIAIKGSIDAFAHLTGTIVHHCKRNEVLKGRFDNITYFSRTIAKMGPQAYMSDLIQALVRASCRELGTEQVAIFTINPCIGGIDCSNTPEVTDAMQSAFLDMYNSSISNRECHKAWVLNDIAPADDNTPLKTLFESGVRSVIASPIRSETGATGAIAAFYSHSQYSPELCAELIETIASIASLAISYSLTVEQLQDYLEDFAGTNQELSVQATIDPLTNLPNQRKLQQTLFELCKSSREDSKKVFSLIMLDVDHFKLYNDTYGHQAGDSVLCNVAKVLSENIRQTDLAARYGGEEFALVIRGASKDHAISVAERIRETISNQLCYTTPVTVSMGIAEFPIDGVTPVEVIEKADRALYQAKITGRNRIVVFNGNLSGEYDALHSAIRTENKDMAA